MHARTGELLARFQDNAWFARVGQPISVKDVKPVARWLDAVDYLTNGYLETIGYQNGVALEQAVVEAGDGMKERWQEAEAHLRPLARDVVRTKIQPIREGKTWSVFVDMIADYDISYALLEKEFEDVIEPAYFATKTRWYLAGHLPCGFTAHGKLVVY